MMKIGNMNKEGQERYAKVVNRSCLVCLLFFSTTEHVLASDINESFDVQVILKQVAGLVSTLKDGPDKFVLLGELGVVQAKAGNIGDASRSMVGMPDGFQNDYQKNRLKKEIALAQAKAGKTQSALEIAKTITSLEREYTLGSIALEKAKSGDVPGALVILQRNGMGTNATADALKAIGELQAIRGDLRGGIQTALQAADRDPHILWGIAKEQIKLGHLKEMLSEVRRIPLDLPRQYALWGVVLAQIGNKDIAGAIEVAKTIPDGHASTNAWQDIAIVQIEAGSIQEGLVNLKRALGGASATQNSLAKSDILYQIAVSQAKAGDVAGALQTTELVEIVAHKNHAIREIAVYQAKTGDLKEALQTASRFNAEISGPPPYVFILQDLARSGKVRQALQIAASIDSELEYSPYEAIAAGQAESGDIEGALRTLDAIKWKGEMAPYDRARAFEKISYMQVQNGHLEEAVRIVSMIDEPHRARALRDVSLAYVKEGKVDRALENVSSIKGEQALADLSQKIAYAQAFQGDTQGVMKWTQKIASPFVKSTVLLGAVQGILDASNRPILQ
jgi:tetratricopeptide (TPR) repeat protein